MNKLHELVVKASTQLHPGLEAISIWGVSSAQLKNKEKPKLGYG